MKGPKEGLGARILGLTWQERAGRRGIAECAQVFVLSRRLRWFGRGIGVRWFGCDGAELRCPVKQGRSEALVMMAPGEWSRLDRMGAGGGMRGQGAAAG